MATCEQDRKVEEKKPYTSPEIISLGDARELTCGQPDLPLTDASPKPNGYKDI